MTGETAVRRRGNPLLRYGYWMQLWAALYALTAAWPNPGLVGLVLVVVALLGALIYATRPPTWGGQQ